MDYYSDPKKDVTLKQVAEAMLARMTQDIPALRKVTITQYEEVGPNKFKIHLSNGDHFNLQGPPVKVN